MKDTKEILSLDDIKKLVDTFYGKVRNDALIGPIFNEKIQDRWPQHLEKMYTFWQTILLGEHTYFGSPFPPRCSCLLKPWMNYSPAIKPMKQNGVPVRWPKCLR